MRHRLSTTLAGLLLAVPAVALAAPGVQAADDRPGATGPAAVADALRRGPVYVDPRAAGELPARQAQALEQKIEKADKPLFVAVLPKNADYPPKTVLATVRAETGVTGLYAVRLGAGFNAGADASVLSHRAVGNLVSAVKAGGTPGTAAQLNTFVDRALPQMKGSAPSSWHSSGEAGGPTAGLIVLGAIVVAGGAGAYTMTLRSRRRQREQDQAELEKLRVVVDEDITAFGEELDRLDFHPGEAGADDAMRGDYTRALDAYERAKSLMGSARRPGDVRSVTEALEDGRFALASLAARRTGAPLPERRPPCFFDPRHGPSVADAEWAPEGGAPRTVPVCAADAARISDGLDPQARTVETDHGRRPYWEAGPAYAPWAGGYFGGGMLPGLLIGTLLGSALTSPAYGFGGSYGDAGGYQGGDYSGSDFDPGDFGGGGGFGGGDTGGGGGF